jgi:hypothetical protein
MRIFGTQSNFTSKGSHESKGYCENDWHQPNFTRRVTMRARYQPNFTRRVTMRAKVAVRTIGTKLTLLEGLP